MEVEEASHSTHVNTRGLARLECLHPLQGGERRLEDGGSELLEGGVIDLELGLGDLDEHFIVLATGELTLVLGALARAATVVENGDDGREVLGGHAVRAKLLRGGPLGARADLRVGRGNRTKDGDRKSVV